MTQVRCTSDSLLLRHGGVLAYCQFMLHVEYEGCCPGSVRAHSDYYPYGTCPVPVPGPFDRSLATGKTILPSVASTRNTGSSSISDTFGGRADTTMNRATPYHESRFPQMQLCALNEAGCVKKTRASVTEARLCCFRISLPQKLTQAFILTPQ